jgi:hypothetical protein
MVWVKTRCEDTAGRLVATMTVLRVVLLDPAFLAGEVESSHDTSFFTLQGTNVGVEVSV